MTYEEFRQQCNDFIDLCDARATEFASDETLRGYLTRMKNAVISVMACANHAERNGEPFR
jgi:hypothetical protein